MRHLIYKWIGLALCLAGGALANTTPAITLVNAAGIEQTMFDEIRGYVQQQLGVTMRTEASSELKTGDSFATWEQSVADVKTAADVVFIVLGSDAADARHLVVNVERGICVVNVGALSTVDSLKFKRRIERQVMRAAAFSMEMAPTPDPFCVTRDYKNLKDLDTMGRNFSPPWMGRFAKEAAARGLLLPPSTKAAQ